ncbi:UNVERIFIED_ORG: hypothetical protein M2348_001054 [Sphingomonas sp. R1F5B]
MAPDTPDIETAGDVPPPIEVAGSPVREQLMTSLRQALPPIAAFVVGRGYVANDTAALLGALAAIAWPIIDGQRRTLKRSRTLATLAAAAPDSVAVVK